jgi:hypothetical protein
MSLQRSIDEHSRICALIPWYLNGTAVEADRRLVENHVRECPGCRADLEQERRVYEAMCLDPGVEYMPAASLKKLTARLDELEAAARETRTGEARAREMPGREMPGGSVSVREALADETPGRSTPVPSRQGAAARIPWRGLVAASIALAALALSLVAADRWLESREASYHTVTVSAARPPGEVIRAVFAPNITLMEMQSILDEAHLRIVSGPTEAGVYSLASTSSRPVGASLRVLRAHATVRFAESTR